MSLKHQHDLHIKEKTSFEQKPEGIKKGLSRNGNAEFSEITLELIFQKLFAGLHKQYIALKYQFHKYTSGAFSQIKLPWLKIGVVVVVFFILAKKDVQFSINMKAPLAGIIDDNNRGEDNQMGIFQSSSVKESAFNLPEVQELDEERVASYIKRFSKVAISEKEKFGIPASIKMAQGILESWSGTHPEAKQNNNHFGPHLSGQHFNSAWENWRAHSQLLKENVPEFHSVGNDYHRWADKLQEIKYAADPHYSEKLLSVIQKYRLDQLDEH